MHTQELVAQLGTVLGVPSLSFVDGVCHLSLEEGLIPVSLETNEAGTLLHMCAHIGVLYSDAPGVAQALLILNGAFNALGKGCFALEGEGSDIITYMQLLNCEHYSFDAFLEAVNQFALGAQEWQKRLLENDFGIADDEDEQDEVFPSLGIRI